jgi:tetratricopeptide (TPR) repeat protein
MKIQSKPLKPIEDKTKTPASQLRDTLTVIENILGKLEHSQKEKADTLPSLFDEASLALQKLQEKGVPLTAEQTRLESALAVFEKKAKIFLRIIGGSQTLKDMRPEAALERDHWWWYLDEIVRQKRISAFKKIISWVVIAGVILSLLGIIYARFFAPSPEEQALYAHQSQASEHLIAGDFEQALSETEAGLAIDPNNASLLILKGVLLENLDRSQEAIQFFARAEDLLPDRKGFLISRAQAYYQAKNYAASLSDAQELIARFPDTGYGYFFQGLAQNELGDKQAAIESIDRASQVALEAGENELAGLARIILSDIMATP